MRIRSILLSAILLFFSIKVFSQSYSQDAYSLSQPVIGGTARIQALGGSQVSLGGDMSNLSGNPAGLGFFRKTEISITSGIGYNYSKANYLNQSTSDNKFFFNVPNFGAVFSGAKDDIVGGKWRGGSFGISFNRSNSFQNQFSYSGLNQRTSFLDFLASQASDYYASTPYGLNAKDLYNAVNPNTFTADNPAGFIFNRAAAAYYSFLILPVPDKNNKYLDSDQYYRFNDGTRFNDPKSPVPDQPFVSNMTQSGKVNTTGGSGQWSISYGGNYNNKLYIGGTLGVPRINYNTKRSYTENFKGNDDVRLINSFTYNEEKNVVGTGVNFKLGLIYRLNDYVRIGATAVSPSIISMKETFSGDITPYFVDKPFGYYYSYTKNSFDSTDHLSSFNGYSTKIAQNNNKYNLTTPAQLSGGLSLFLGKKGFFTADIDYIPYKMMRVNGSTIDAGINTAIQNTYKNILNFRAGIEGRFDIFRVRIGGSYLSDPYQTKDVDRSRINYTAGMGVRWENFYFDVSGVYSTYKSGYTPYSLYETTDKNNNQIYTTHSIANSQNVSPSASITNSPVSLLVTVGFRFN